MSTIKKFSKKNKEKNLFADVEGAKYAKPRCICYCYCDQSCNVGCGGVEEWYSNYQDHSVAGGIGGATTLNLPAT